MKKLRGITLIIFDLDGTLIDSVPYHAKAFVEICRRQGIKISESRIRALMGEPSRQIFEYLIKKHNLKGKIPELRNKRRKIFFKILGKKDISFPGIVQTLKKLKSEHKYTLAIATGTSLKSFNYSITAELREIFDFISTIDRVKHGKPSPEQMLSVVKKFKMQKRKKEVLVLGDSIYDAIAAKRAGLNFIGVRTGFQRGKPLEKYRHFAIINSVKDLKKIL